MNQKSILTLAVAAAFSLVGQVNAQIVINEIESDTFNMPTTDYAEFIELYSLSGTITSLDGLTLVLFNGNGDVSYAVLDLDGLFTDANGYFLIGTTNLTGVTVDNTSLLGVGNVLQNGQDAVALYSGNFAGGAATTLNLLDVVVYGTDDPDDTGLLTALGETIQFNEGPNPGSDAANMSLQRFANGTGDFVLATPTPDAVNVPEPSCIAMLGFAALGGLVRRRSR
jgi:uncharacterized protein